MKEWDDDKLVRCAMHGDRQAIGSLVNRYARVVFGFCLSMVGRPADAEDLAQEVFMKVYLKISELTDARRFRPWILRICRNRCRDFLRAQQRERNRAMPPSPETPSQDRFPVQSRLEESLGQLPEKYRLPLILYYLDGQNTRDVAQSLGITSAGVLTRLCRARQCLRNHLTQEADHA